MREFTTLVSCGICSTTFVRNNSRSRYCSDPCRLTGERDTENARIRRVGRREDDPLKRRARKEVENVIKSGNMQRPQHCENCARSGKPQAHHHRGYEKAFWLDVVWLCAKCHRNQHLEKVAA